MKNYSNRKMSTTSHQHIINQLRTCTDLFDHSNQQENEETGMDVTDSIPKKRHKKRRCYHMLSSNKRQYALRSKKKC